MSPTNYRRQGLGCARRSHPNAPSPTWLARCSPTLIHLRAATHQSACSAQTQTACLDSVLELRRPPRRPSSAAWEGLDDQQLLDVRLCDLGLKLEGSWLHHPIERLQAQLQRRGCRVKPHFWLSDEWMTPDDCIGMGIPFFLVHPRLSRLERHFMFGVEGGTFRSAMQLLRHETGHVVCNAYRLHRLPSWRRTFGSPAIPYPKSYTPNPESKRFVQHLEGWYAQSHPDEDWAETFAVWLGSAHRWRAHYKDWPALTKLEYTDQLMARLAREPLRLRSRTRPYSLAQLQLTLRQYYEQKQQRYQNAFPRIFDRTLRSIFVSEPRVGFSAARVVQRNRHSIMRAARTTCQGTHQVPADVVDAVIARCRELELRSTAPEHVTTEQCARLVARCARFNPISLGRYAI